MGSYREVVERRASMPPVLVVLMEDLNRRAVENCQSSFLRVGKFEVLSRVEYNWKKPCAFQAIYRGAGGGAPSPAPAARNTRMAIGQHREKAEWSIALDGSFEMISSAIRPVQNAPEPPGVFKVRRLGAMPPTETVGVNVCQGVAMQVAVAASLNDAAERQLGAKPEQVAKLFRPMIDGMCVRALTYLSAAARDSYASDILSLVLRAGVLDYMSVQVAHLEGMQHRIGDYNSPEFKEFKAFGEDPTAYIQRRLAVRTVAGTA